MSDIASLGLRIDSSQVASGTTALDKFSAAAKNAENNANAVTKAAGNGGTQIAKSGELARHEMINLSRQLQDVGVSLVSGQSPFLVFMQQGSQVADIFGSSKTGSVGGAIKQIGSGIASFLTPMRAAGLGVTALAAAGYAAYESWKSFTLQLDDTARAAGTTTASMSKLQAAASVKGISGDDFAKGIQNFSRNVYDAKNNMGGLAEVFQVNNMRAQNFDDAMEKAADLIRNARDDQQRLVLLQQMGLPPTMEWVRLMSGGAEGVRKAKEEMAGFAANDNAVRKAREFDEAWNRAWANFGLNARSAFQTAMTSGGGFFSYVEDKMNRFGNSDFWKRFYNPDAAKAAGIEIISDFEKRFNGIGANPSAGNTVLADAMRQRADAIRKGMTDDPAAIARALQLEQARLGIYGQTLTVKEQLRAIDIQIAQYNLQPGALALDEKRVETLKRLAVEQALGITQIKASTDAQRVEAETVGMSVGQATAYASAQNAINDARRKGMALTPENIAAIQAEANALGEAAKKADEMKWQYENLVRGPLQTFRQSLMSGASVFDALKKAANSALDSISSKLMDMIAQDLWKKALGGGSLTSLLSGLGLGGGDYGAPGTTLIGPPAPSAAVNHSGYGPGDAITTRRAVHPAHFANAPRFHSGIGPGERAAVLRNDESVLTPGQMRQLAPTDSAGPRVQVNIKNYSGAQVDHRQSSQGGLDIHDIVIAAVQKGTASGELDSAMSRFSASPGTRRR